MHLKRPVVRWLSHPRLPLGVALLAVAVALPSLRVGWLMDDLFQQMVRDYQIKIAA